jgi:hypothetical protein
MPSINLKNPLYPHSHLFNDEKIETNELEKYIIWRLKIVDKNIESFIFSGIRNDKLIGISLSDNNKNLPLISNTALKDLLLTTIG